MLLLRTLLYSFVFFSRMGNDWGGGSFFLLAHSRIIMITLKFSAGC